MFLTTSSKSIFSKYKNIFKIIFMACDTCDISKKLSEHNILKNFMTLNSVEFWFLQRYRKKLYSLSNLKTCQILFIQISFTLGKILTMINSNFIYSAQQCPNLLFVKCSYPSLIQVDLIMVSKWWSKYRAAWPYIL